MAKHIKRPHARLVSSSPVEKLRLIEEEHWDDGTVTLWRRVPFPVQELLQFITQEMMDAAPVRRVDLSILRATQEKVSQTGVEKHLLSRAAADYPVVALVSKNKAHIIDGHHRLTAAWLRGEPTAAVRVIDVPPDGEL